VVGLENRMAMTRVRRFEELQCWQKARQLANAVHQLAIRPDFAGDFDLRQQIEGASGSVMHNIAEGHDSGTDPEFVRFLKIARRSAGEVQSELYLAVDRKYITEAELQSAYFLADEAKRLINGLIAYLRKSASSGFPKSQIRDDSAYYQAADYQTNDKGLFD
jgi:four helix bundle protein